MKKLLLALVVVVHSFFALSQISYGGKPYDWENKHLSASIPFISTEALNYSQLNLEDAITDQYKELPYRFGVEIETSYTLENAGNWSIDTDRNLMIWQLGIHCPDALGISTRFDEFYLPKGAELFIWSANREEFIGAFNHRNNKKSNSLATSIVSGDQIVIELVMPVQMTEEVKLKVGQIVHVYRPFLNAQIGEDDSQQRGPFGNSGDCEVNVNCPEGADWQVEKRAVAIIVEGGYGMCTGALVNNTLNDGTPYFLTANHCTQGANVGNWIYYFNHESTSCNGSTGPTSQSISGSSLVANNGDSDFALLLLDDTPTAAFNVQYAGWDATDSENTVQSAVGIHHPSGDIKKISFEEDAPYHDTGNGADVWWIDDWELGVTEPGSSGSPLFNQDHRIIGQLFGGASACSGSNGNGQYDFYGRFGVSWDNSNSANARLMDWLDPNDSGVLVLDGYPDGFVVANVDGGVSGIEDVPSTICNSTVSPTFTLSNQGATILTSCTINFQLNNDPIQTMNWTGSLSQGENEVVELPELTLGNGDYDLEIWITNLSGGTDENSNNNSTSISFTAITDAAYTVTLDLQFDNYPEETSWEIQLDGNAIFFGGLYTDQAASSSLTLNMCMASGCYDLVIFDDYGDGMCCGFFNGNGSYTLTSAGQTLANGGEFADSETTTFCLGANVVEKELDVNPIVFPNPSSNRLAVKSNFIMSGIKMYDSSGRMVLDTNPNNSFIEINTSALADGIYQLITVGSEYQGTARIVVKH